MERKRIGMVFRYGVAGATLVMAMVLAGCSRAPEKRQYEEVMVRVAPTQPREAPSAVAAEETPARPTVADRPAAVGPVGPVSAVAADSAMLGDVPGAGISLAWTTPEGWREQAASGVRLATFFAGPENALAECTITAFPGDVGGTEANLRRWVGQLNRAVPAPAVFQAFVENALSFQTAGGLQAALYDFTDLLPDLAAGDMSMLAGVLRHGDSTVFIKMMGARSILDAERGRFEALCRSIRPVTPGAGGA